MTAVTRIFSLTPGTPGSSTQKPRTIRSTPAPACDAAKRLANAPVFQLVQLADDPGGTAGAVVGDFRLDQGQEPLAHVDRGDEQPGVIALEGPVGTTAPRPSTVSNRTVRGGSP